MEEMEIRDAVEFIINKGAAQNRYNGNDNYNKPKSKYIKKVVKMSDNELLNECTNIITMSAYTSNIPKCDYHWKRNCCYDEYERRNKLDIYNIAQNKANKRLNQK